jgi:hypothetical protein
MKKIITILLLLLSPSIFSWETPPVRGYWITSKDASTYYGHTNYHGNWKILQWSIPKELKPFNHKNTTKNKHAVVKWVKDKNYIRMISIGKHLPCGDELDLLQSPLSIEPSKSINLYKELSIIFSIKRIFENVYWSNCDINKGSEVIGLIFKNDKENKVFFYQLGLSDVNYNQVRPVWIRSGAMVDGKKRWLYDDMLTEHVDNYVSFRKWYSYDLELYDHIINLFKDKIIETEEELDDWKLTGTYLGSRIWGNVKLGAEWSNIKVRLK